MRFRLAMAGLFVTTALVTFLLVLFLIVPASSSESYRTDWVGLQVRVTVPSSWSRRPVATGWIYDTSCGHMGLKAVQSVQTPLQTLVEIDPQDAARYAPIVGNDYAEMPGFLLKQIKPGVQLMVLYQPICTSDKALNRAVASAR